MIATTLEVERIDPTIEIDYITDRFRPKQDNRIDRVLCCVDSISARAAIWRSVSATKSIFGSMAGCSAEVIRVLTASEEVSVQLLRIDPVRTIRCSNEALARPKATIYTAAIAAGLMVHQLTLAGCVIYRLDRDTTCNLTGR